MKVKDDNRSKFSNLSNWKEEAWKTSTIAVQKWITSYTSPVFTELKMQTDFLAFIIGNSRQVILLREMVYYWRQWVLFHC